MESDLTALAVLAHHFRIMDTVRSFSHVLGNFLVIDDTLPVMLCLWLSILLLITTKVVAVSILIKIALVVFYTTGLDKRVFIDAVLIKDVA